MATIFQGRRFRRGNLGTGDTETGTAVQGDALVPMTVFLVDPDAFLARDGKTAVIVEAGDDVELIEKYLDRLALVAVDFPSFSDGRGFSAARILREQIGYKGDIRALGKYILDQVPLARRCGVSTFEISKLEVLKALKAGEWPEVTNTCSRSAPSMKSRKARAPGRAALTGIWRRCGIIRTSLSGRPGDKAKSRSAPQYE